MVRFEHRREPLIPTRAFLGRLFRSAVAAGALIAGALLIGICGYRWFGRLDWLDALLNASMILTGMGPVDRMETRAAKLFASAYALFSGVAFLTIIGVLIAPVVHRFIHRFHLEEDSKRDR